MTWWASEEAAAQLMVMCTCAPRARARSSGSRTSTAAASGAARPSRSVSKGRDRPVGPDQRDGQHDRGGTAPGRCAAPGTSRPGHRHVAAQPAAQRQALRARPVGLAAARRRKKLRWIPPGGGHLAHARSEDVRGRCKVRYHNVGAQPQVRGGVQVAGPSVGRHRQPASTGRSRTAPTHPCADSGWAVTADPQALSGRRIDGLSGHDQPPQHVSEHSGTSPSAWPGTAGENWRHHLSQCSPGAVTALLQGVQPWRRSWWGRSSLRRVHRGGCDHPDR